MTIHLNTNHSEKNRVEAFLSILNEKLEQLPFDWQSLKESSRIDDALKLTNLTKSLIITVIFVKDYCDADLVAKANFINGEIRWGQNGSIMYIVEASDQNKISNVLSTFAGKE